MDSGDIPSLTLGAEINRGRRHGASSVTKTSVAESDISADGSPSAGEQPSSREASLTHSPSTSAVPVAYSGYDVENDKGELADTATGSLQERQQSVEDSNSSSSDVESVSKKSRSSSSSSQSEGGSPSAVKHKTKTQQITKPRSSYATALAAKLRQNRLALEERSCRRPDTSTSRLQSTDVSPSVINKSLATTETGLQYSDSNLVTDNGLNVEQIVTANKQLEMMCPSSTVSCSAPVPVVSCARFATSQSAVHREIPSTAAATSSLSWYVLCV